MARKITVEVPDKKIVRVKRKKDVPRRWLFDFRGIRSNPPSQLEIDRLTGRVRMKKSRGERAAFTSPEILQRDCDEYFESCYGPLIHKGRIVKDENGEIVKVQKRPFTVSGLAYHLGIETSTFNRYCNGQMDDLGAEFDDEMFSKILERARQRIEIFAEENLYNRDAQNGARFVLDAHFSRITQKEKAEIAERMNNIEMKRQELDLKKQALSISDDEDNSIEIVITRKDE